MIASSFTDEMSLKDWAQSYLVSIHLILDLLLVMSGNCGSLQGRPSENSHVGN